jgi:hypothetical protein
MCKAYKSHCYSFVLERTFMLLGALKTLQFGWGWISRIIPKEDNTYLKAYSHYGERLSQSKPNSYWVSKVLG